MTMVVVVGIQGREKEEREVGVERGVGGVGEMVMVVVVLHVIR